jgi:outer membrane protein OmpA-like peptidoglycan-associated protein/tetratricopeptide (TPR) repeat protein
MSWIERICLLVLWAVAMVPAASAQWDDEEEMCASVLEGKTLKLYEKGINGSKYDRTERVAFLEEAFDRDDQCMACLFEWGRLEFNSIKRSRGSFYPAQQPLKQLIDACPFFRAEAWYMLGAMAYADREYEAAQSYFEEYLRFPPASEEILGKRRDRYLEEVKEVLPTIAFELAFRQNEGKYHPASIPPVSTLRDEFLPALSPDGSLLFFTRRERYKAKGDVVSTESEVFYAAEREVGEEFNAGTALESPFNSGARYGGASISVDNRELYIAASNPTGKNPDNIDLYVTEYEILDKDDNGEFFYIWGPLAPVEALNTSDGWEAQPALSSDGNELFFAAVNADSRQDLNGNLTMDIWSAERNEVGEWQPAQMLPFPINSDSNDKAPFLHPDGKTLYFASDRQPGGGGYDIWMSRRDSSGMWGEATNFGAPLNTSGDEQGLVVSTNGAEAFFSGRRDGTQGMDIIRFPVPDEMKPESVFIVQGDLLGPDNEVPEGARLYLQYAQSKNVQEIEVNRQDGHFASVVRAAAGEDVLLVAEADGIAFEAQVVFDADSEAAPPDRMDAPLVLEEAANGEPFEIGDIQFATNSAEINRTSLLMLDLFAAYLLRNDAIGVHIKGHTDDRGQPADNQVLSEDRAARVAFALKEFGVPSNRITHEGFGQSRPVASNATAEGRSRNRRTEFEIRLAN